MSPEMGARVVDALDEGLGDVRTITIHLYGGESFTNLPAVQAIVNRALQKKNRTYHIFSHHQRHCSIGRSD
jgi:hypothetical protein